jgi:hypothetical protein
MGVTGTDDLALSGEHKGVGALDLGEGVDEGLL